MRSCHIWATAALLFAAHSPIGTCTTALAASESAGQPDAQVAEFGIEPGKPIDTGFVFWEGRYLDPPYTVSRKGLALLINDHVIKAVVLPASTTDQAAKGRLVRRIDRERDQYEQALRKNDCYFCFADGRHKHIVEINVAYRLPYEIATLRSNASSEFKREELKRRNWHLSLSDSGMETLITNFQAPDRFDARIAALAESLCQVDEFGTTHGNPVDKGFVFIDGQYIEAPYIVSRRGLSLFVNGRMIQEPDRVTAPATAPASEPVDPILPADIDRETSKYDPLVVKYLGDKIGYVNRSYPEAERREILKKAYLAMPCVDRVELATDAPAVLVVTWSDGTVERERVIPIEGRTPASTDRDSVLQRLEEQRRNLEGRLGKGDYYFFLRGMEVTGGASASKFVLPRLVPILRSAGSPQARLEQAKKAGLAFDSNIIEELVRGFSASPQLDARLAELVAKPATRAP